MKPHQVVFSIRGYPPQEEAICGPVYIIYFISYVELFKNKCNLQL
jgi:hypothetical protein